MSGMGREQSFAAPDSGRSSVQAAGQPSTRDAAFLKTASSPAKKSGFVSALTPAPDAAAKSSRWLFCVALMLALASEVME